MKIKLGEWCIDSVSPSGDWQIYREQTSEETGDTYEAHKSYYGKMHQAALAVLNHRLTESDASDIKQVIAVIREEAKEIKNMCTQVEDLFRQALAKESRS